MDFYMKTNKVDKIRTEEKGTRALCLWYVIKTDEGKKYICKKKIVPNGTKLYFLCTHFIKISKY